MKYFDTNKRAIAWLGTKSNSVFWDKLWNADNIKAAILQKKHDFIVLPTTKKFLKKGSKILEGGCGHGSYVYHLEKSGYKTVGVDFAKNTVRKIKKAFPSLKVIYGDLRKLKFKNKSFDGYWSLGVIEHFYESYDEVLGEMARILKRDGFLFITFPYMSPFRKLKVFLNLYQKVNYKKEPENFYQFALDHKVVIKKITKHGFRLKCQKPFDGFRGIRSELPLLDFILEPIDMLSINNLSILVLRYIIGRLVQPFASHSILLIFKKD